MLYIDRQRGIMKFSSFKQFLDTFGEERLKKNLDSLLDDRFIMYFKKGKEVFGAGEDGRLVFAKLKNPDEETPSGWEKEASFSADNLTKTAQGEPTQCVFSNEDMKKIKVINRDEAYKLLEKVAKKGPPTKQQFRVLDLSKFLPKDPDQAPNFIQAKEKS
jgi:hypothetical protein